MKKIAFTALLDHFERMANEKWAYRWGAAAEGTVDCAGAFVWAYRQAGIGLYHGSNRIARTEAEKLLPLACAAPGMLAFKRRKPGDKGYALPESYRMDADQNDYYHIGLVDRDARFVLNAKGQSAGFVRSRLDEGWDAVAFGRHIDYTIKETKMIHEQPARVTAETGSTVNLRLSPGKHAKIVCQIPVGSSVFVHESENGWARVSCLENGRDGFMMAQFLDMGENAPALAELVSQLKGLVEQIEQRVKEETA